MRSPCDSIMNSPREDRVTAVVLNYRRADDTLKCIRSLMSSEGVSPGIIVDFDDQERVVGIEMLYLSKRAPDTGIRRLLFESVPQPV